MKVEGKRYHAGTQSETCLIHLKKMLIKLADNHGWFIIGIPGQCIYCQLRRNQTEGKTRFEAVSHYYNESLDKGLKKKFNSLGFKMNGNENYTKKIMLYSDDAVNKTAIEIMKIFKMIYKAGKESVYEFDDQINEN